MTRDYEAKQTIEFVNKTTVQTISYKNEVILVLKHT